MERLGARVALGGFGEEMKVWVNTGGLGEYGCVFFMSVVCLLSDIWASLDSDIC